MHLKLVLFLFLFVNLLAENTHPQTIAAGRRWVVDQRHILANDNNPGTRAKPFKTISKAAALAMPGDTVMVQSGVYREWVAPLRGGKEGKPVIYMAAQKGRVVIKGSEIYKGKWKAVPGHKNIFSTKIDRSFFTTGFNPFAIVFSEGRGGGRQGQVFIDGREIFEAGQNISTDNNKDARPKEDRMNTMFAQPGSWSTTDGETLYLHLPPHARPLQQSIIEIAVRRHLFAPVHRAQDYIHVKGFIFEHCANDPAFPQVGAVSCRSGQHWLVEDNIIRNIKTVGLDCGAEDEDPWLLPDTQDSDRFLVGRHHDIFTPAQRRMAGRHLILNNTVSNCGQCGIAGLFSDGTVIMGNTIEGCGKIVPGFETGGIKIHGLMGGTIEANLVRNNEAWGIWLDCGYIGSRVTRNVVVNNNISGIFFECSNGPGLIDNNIVAYNRGDGIYTHDASGVSIINNLIFGNNSFVIYMCVATDRLVPPYHYATGLYENELSACSWERIYNNIIAANKEGIISLPFTAARATDNKSDNNLLDGLAAREKLVLHVRNGAQGQHISEDSAAKQAFLQTGDPGVAGATLASWKNGQGLAMNLYSWQQRAGNDSNSLQAAINISLSNSYRLTINVDSSVLRLHTKIGAAPAVHSFEKFARVMDKDFFGVLIPAEHCKPGAFQQIKPGYNQFQVWPVLFTYPAMPPKLPEEPDLNSPAFKPVPPPGK
jgi:parallel beta-helix repeat protein